MKLNNKGFAVSTIMYMILVMAVILITLTLTLLSNRKLILDKTKEEAKENIYTFIRLPLKYQELEYIESTGSQAIEDLYIIPSNYEKIEFLAKIRFSDISTEQGIFGVDSSLEIGYSPDQDEIKNRILFYMYNSDYNILTSDVISDITANDIEIKASLEPNKRSLYDNYSKKTQTVEGENILTANQLDLFVYKGYSVSYYFKGKMYYAKVIVNDEVVRDMVPCYRKSDGVIGMYDLVGGEFYPGTGTFVNGPDVK